MSCALAGPCEFVLRDIAEAKLESYDCSLMAADHQLWPYMNP